jgi:hypothetical protein
VEIWKLRGDLGDESRRCDLLRAFIEAEVRFLIVAAYRSYRSVEGLSDGTTLPDSSVRLITPGRALHWFPAESTRVEFCRILEPEGWLAILSVPCTDSALLDDLRAVRTPKNGWDLTVDKELTHRVSSTFYFGHDMFRTLTVAGSLTETWEAFLGRISSMAPAREANHPRRRAFERAVRHVFEQHADAGVLQVSNATKIVFGQLHRPRSPSRVSSG